MQLVGSYGESIWKKIRNKGVIIMVGIISDIGNVRSKNEDSVIYYEDSIKGIYIVADGMGGYNSGEIASSMAVKDTLDYLKSIEKKENVEIEMKKAIEIANSSIFQSSTKNIELKGMGTTITGCIKINGELIVGHVGDSSCYLVFEDCIKKLTKDHSLVQQLLDSGSISEEEAINHPNRNIITRALGTNESVEVDLYKRSLNGIKKIILCTDGLSNFVSSEEMYEIILLNDNEESSKKLIQLGKEKGSRDNLSVIVFEGEVR